MATGNIKAKIGPKTEIQVRTMNFGRKSSIGELKDVNITGITDGEFLRYDLPTSTFLPYAFPATDHDYYKTFTDGTNTTTPTTNDVFRFRGSADVNVAVLNNDSIYGDNLQISLVSPFMVIAGTNVHLGGSLPLDTLLGGTLTNGLIKRTTFNTLATAVVKVDYAPPTTGTSMLRGDGAGGFAAVGIGTGILYSTVTGILSLPQAIDTSAAVTFASLSLTGALSSASVSTTGNVTIGGNLTVNGTTTTINATTVSVDDINITLGDTASPTDTSANGGGITLRGSSDKTLNWVQSTTAWTSSENFEVAAGKTITVGAGQVLLSNSVTTTSTTVDQLLMNLATGVYRSAKFVISATNTTTGFYQSVEIMAIQNGAAVAHVEYASISIGGNVSTFNVTYSAGINLVCTPAAASSTVFRVSCMAVKV